MVAVSIAIAVAYFFIGISLSSSLFDHQVIAGLLSLTIAVLVVWVCHRRSEQTTTVERKATRDVLSERVSQPVSQPLPLCATRVWLDVGAHLGEKTFPAAQSDSGLQVYAFEPTLPVASKRMGLLPNFIMLPMAVAERDGSAEFYVNTYDAASSLLPLNPEGLEKWTGGEQLKVERQYVVPVLRLDTFLDRAGIGEVEFLKIDAQGADLAVIRSAGERLKDIRKISLEVQITPVPLYRGAAQKKDVLRYMDHAGFKLIGAERQSYDQEENLTFERMESPFWANQMQALEAAKAVVFVRSLAPYPGWTFAAGWDNPDSAFHLRRRIWEYFNDHKFEIPFVFEWYGGLRLNLYLGNDLSRQLFIAGCTEPNAFAFLEGLLVPGMVFIDAGANDGLFTLFASRRVGPEGKVWAFEPSEREFVRLEQNLTLNQIQNVRPFRVALAERNGEEDLAVAGYEHEGQNTLGAFVYEGVQQERTERVMIRKLDDLVREEKLPKVDVMKLDVEGAEHRVLEGAREVVTGFRPLVLFEVLDAALQKQGSSWDKLLELFRSLSYELFIWDSRNGQPAPAPAGGFSDNMIAIPAESPAVGQFPS